MEKETNFLVLFTDLFQTSSEPTSSYLEALLLYMVLNPEVQRKVQAEIDTVIHTDEDVSMDHKSR